MLQFRMSPTEQKIELQSPAKPANTLSTMLLPTVSLMDNSAPKMFHGQLYEQKSTIKL